MKKYLPIIIAVLVVLGFAVVLKTAKNEAQIKLAEKADLIRVNSPSLNEIIKSPLTVTGEARGNWFFEASFPVILTDWNGKIIAQGPATAESDWMTADFVPFKATLTFAPRINTYNNKGTLILKKDNPSGLPENDDSIEIPIIFADKEGSSTACTMEAKLCPDGSYVSRSGPNCEFTACPAGNGIAPYNSGIQGTVMLGPTCPVMREPPDPECADKPYQTSIYIFHANDTTHSFVASQSGADGTFKVALPPGDYIVEAGSGSMLPRCTQTAATVGNIGYTTVSIYCDTGIR